jgi:hypothetical protein
MAPRPPFEDRLSMLGRVIAAFGLGVLVTTYYGRWIAPWGAPIAVVGIACILIASLTRTIRGRRP